MTFSIWLRDTVERVAVSFGIAILAMLTVTGLSDFDASFARQLGTAGLFAAAVAAKNIALPTAGLGLPPLLDVLARAGWSAVQGGAVVVAADAGFQWYTATAWQAAGVAAVAAAASVIKGFLATKMTTATVTPASLAPTA